MLPPFVDGQLARDRDRPGDPVDCLARMVAQPVLAGLAPIG
jgi:hypothetical protein